MKRQIAILAGGVMLAGTLLLTLPSRATAATAPDQRVSADEKVRQGVNNRAAPLQDFEEVAQNVAVLSGFDDGTSWLGVETSEVNAEKAKELKLPAERGVVLTEIVPDSPAAKAGLKAGDVVTEFNGQHVEGASQFRRFIRETPVGRTVQFTIWRDGHSQTISATLGQAEQRNKIVTRAMPDGETFFRAPVMPRIEIPRFELGGDGIFVRQPVLGISADNLSGQLGTYFGAPDGEGILVREVNSGTSAAKAGIKAGDVIIKVEGERVRNVGDLREKLADKLGDKEEKKTVSLALLRDHKEMTVNVEVERPAQMPKVKRYVGSRRTI